MDLLGRLCAVIGISLVLTLLLLVLYQDDAVQAMDPVPASISRVAAEASVVAEP